MKAGFVSLRAVIARENKEEHYAHRIVKLSKNITNALKFEFSITFIYFNIKTVSNYYY